MSEEEIIKEVERFLDYQDGVSLNAIQGLLDLYNKQKEKCKYYKNQNKIKGELLNKSLNETKKNCISKDKIKEKITYYENLIKINSKDEEIIEHIIQALNEILEESEG